METDVIQKAKEKVKLTELIKEAVDFKTALETNALDKESALYFLGKLECEGKPYALKAAGYDPEKMIGNETIRELLYTCSSKTALLINNTGENLLDMDPEKQKDDMIQFIDKYIKAIRADRAA